jgi:cytidylate kinase
MYRATALHFLNEKLSPLRAADVAEGLKSLQITFQHNPTTLQQETYLNGVNVEDEIRTMRISERVSEVAKVKEIRAALVAQQQKLGQQKGVVMDGRDIGSVVFPEAELKLFMTADVETRAKRRQLELLAKGEHASLEEIKLNLETRDEVDSNRTESPLLKVSDAIEIDTSSLTFSEQVEQIIDLVKKVTLN